ncbi:substrate-binding domain-containing protein [Ahrensia kielensis]|uniref:substrate-binding domain-containing protein n=1 Tax=Ahrensia kielensis TaxID=76980 RepID=UPI00035F32AC|nr:substrate-binding domain-containing protein [Ahrensia kielensis]
MNLKELSELLGLSQTTVSRALNGFPEVSERTRERVQKYASQHNYAPNKSARGLATGQTFNIGHVISTSNQNEMLNPVFGDFVAGVGEIYSANGYKMILSIVPPHEDEYQVYRDMKAQSLVDAVVIQSPTVNDGRIPFLKDLGLPFIVHGRSTECDTPYAWLDVNNRSAFKRATDFLHDLGHRRIALLNGLEHMDFAHRRREGYENSLRSRNITLDPYLVSASAMTEHDGFNRTMKLMRLKNPPTALLTSSILTAFGALRAIQEAGKIVGRDMSIITHDDCLSYFRNNETVPIFTTTQSSVREAGRKLATMLLDIIANPDATPPETLLEAKLTVGRSTGPAPNELHKEK